MILKLRKRHRYIWMALAVLLPIGFLSALMSRPDEAPVNEPAWGETIPVAVMNRVASGQTSLWAASTFVGDDRQLWLEVHIKQASEQPTSSIFLAPSADNNRQQSLLIGTVPSRGNYYYPLDNTAKYWPEYHLFFFNHLSGKAYAAAPLATTKTPQ